jgi:O-antigen ligase
MEFLLLVLVCLAPWGFAGIEPFCEYLLDVGIAVLLALWAVRLLVDGRLSWQKCPVVLCLAGLVWLALVQLAPLPHDLLARLSPATARLYEQLLPGQPEQLAAEVPQPAARLVAGATLSVYPAKTRVELFRLLALLLTFALVRNNIASPRSLSRLFLALVVNGTLLALFAIVHQFSSQPYRIYWMIPTQGAVFGPFICRTHFAFYENVCIGAGIGLLLARRQGRPAANWGRGGLAALLDDPAQLWLGCALALMSAAVLLSLSRGGFLALLGGVVLLALLAPGKWALSWVGPVVVVVGLAVGLLGWLGLQRVENRLATLSTGEALQSRIPLWADAWKLVPDFPLFGTGQGTFSYVEPLHRTHTAANLVHEYAHNELLEALVEGGVLRLGLTLLLLGIIARYGFRAVRRWAGRPAGGLALGALFGFSTLVLQSLGDFGMHMPAIALLGTVLAAQLVALGQPEQAEETAPAGAAPAGAYVLRLGGLAPVLGAVALLVLAALLAGNGGQMQWAERCRDAARVLTEDPRLGTLQRRVDLLETAAEYSPENARLRLELAMAHLESYQQRLGLLNGRRLVAAVAGLPLSASMPEAPAIATSVQVAAALRIATTFGWENTFKADREEAEREHLRPALQNVLVARNVCPLLARPHVLIASHIERFRRAEPRRAYLDRVKLLEPRNPSLYFLFGVEEYADGHIEQACRDWQRSLELADTHLVAILEVTRQSANPQKMLAQVLPERPEVVLAAARHLYPTAKSSAERQALLERALRLSEERGGQTPEDLGVQARILGELGRRADAVVAYQQALGLQPRQAQWRYELALLLAQQRDFRRARAELDSVLVLQPDHPQARQLLRQIAAAEARGK